eukprot:scaffold28558_cov101-Isochrysis_galbana.AAC.6
MGRGPGAAEMASRAYRGESLAREGRGGARAQGRMARGAALGQRRAQTAGCRWFIVGHTAAHDLVPDRDRSLVGCGACVWLPVCAHRG